MVRKNKPLCPIFPPFSVTSLTSHSPAYYSTTSAISTPSWQSVAMTPDRFVGFSHSQKSVSQPRQTPASSSWKNSGGDVWRNLINEIFAIPEMLIWHSARLSGNLKKPRHCFAASSRTTVGFLLPSANCSLQVENEIARFVGKGGYWKKLVPVPGSVRAQWVKIK